MRIPTIAVASVTPTTTADTFIANSILHLETSNLTIPNFQLPTPKVNALSTSELLSPMPALPPITTTVCP